jgi:hypothetical protein
MDHLCGGNRFICVESRQEKKNITDVIIGTSNRRKTTENIYTARIKTSSLLLVLKRIFGPPRSY